jgi:hypothetical protein
MTSPSSAIWLASIPMQHLKRSRGHPMGRLEARAVLAERLENFSLISMALRASDVTKLVDWIENGDFEQVCANAGADPFAVKRQFDKMINRGLTNALSML